MECHKNKELKITPIQDNSELNVCENTSTL